MTTEPVVEEYEPTGDEETDRLQADDDEQVARRQYAGLPVTTANELTDQGTSIILYGPAGAGKTTLAASIADSPYASPTVMIEAEGGGSSIANRKNLDVITVRKWEDIKKFTDQLKRDGDFPWNGIILDNLSEYFDLCKRKIAGVGAPTQPQWGQITNELKDLVRTYRDLARDRGYVVVICAWDEVVRDEVQRASTQLAFTPAFRRELPGIVETIGHIDLTNNPDVRVLDFAPSPRSQNKFRRSTESRAMKIPYKIPYTIDKLPLPDIIAVLKGGEDWPSSKYGKMSKPEEAESESSD